MKILFYIILYLPLLSFGYENVTQARPSKYGSLKNVKCPIEVVPGVGIGPLKLKQHLREVASLGMEMKTVQGSKSTMVVGIYTIGVTQDDIVRYVDAELGDLPDCLQFGKIKIKKKMTKNDLAKLFTNCQKEEVRLGGNLILCDGISISTGGWGGRQKTPLLQVQ